MPSVEKPHVPISFRYSHVTESLLRWKLSVKGNFCDASKREEAHTLWLFSFSFLQLTRHCEIEERFSLNTLSSKGTRAWDHPAWAKVVVGSGVAEGVISARTISQMLVWQPGYDLFRKVCAVKAFFIFKIKANFTFILVSWGRTDPHLGHVSFISQLFQAVSLFPSLHLSGINSPDI